MRNHAPNILEEAAQITKGPAVGKGKSAGATPPVVPQRPAASQPPAAVVAEKNGNATATSPSNGPPNVTSSRIGPYILSKTLGVGSTGRVKLGTHQETGEMVAVKIVSREALIANKEKSSSTSPVSAAQIAANRKIEREITIMKLIQHPSVLGLYDVYETDSELFLVLEHVEGGELFDYLVKRGRLSENEALEFFQQIIYGLDFCHRHLICHRDLKPENLLLDANLNVKIADFGMASLQVNGKMLETSCGSPHYASPEIIRGVRYDGAAADIWSCGVILYALLTGNLPFDDENIRRLLSKVKSGFYYMPEHICPEAADLIRRMLVVDVMKRISMKEILSHPWFVSRPPKNAQTPIPSPDTESMAVTKIVVGENGYDEDILNNLQLLGWSDESALMQSLQNNGPTLEKVFYHLLARRKHDYFENYDERDNEQEAATDGPRRRTDSSASIYAGRARSESHLGGSEVSSLRTNKSRDELTADSEGSESDTSMPRRRAASNATSLSPNGSTSDRNRRTTMEPSAKSKGSTTVRVNSPLVASFNDISISASVSESDPVPIASRPKILAASADALATERAPSGEKKTKLNIAIPKHNPMSTSMGSPKFHRKGGAVLEAPYPSPVITSSPKRSWFANLFNFKPEVQNFVSALSRDQTLKVLEEKLGALDLGEMKIYAKKENGWKVKFEGRAEGDGQASLKTVKFRVEVAPTLTVAAAYLSSATVAPEKSTPKTITVSLIQTQGAYSSFQTVCDHLRHHWDLEGEVKG